MLSNVKKKKCDENLVLGNTYNGKTYCWQVNTRLMFKFLWEMIFLREIWKFSKLLEISCLQLMKSKLTIIP